MPASASARSSHLLVDCGSARSISFEFPWEASREMGEAAALQRTRSLGAVIKEKDEELALFLEMRRLEKERGDSLLLDSTEELDPPPGSKPGSSPIFKIVSTAPPRRAAPEDILNSDSEKNDYDWLLTPPSTPLFPSLEKESNLSGQCPTPKARATLLKSRLANPADAPSKANSLSKQMQSGSNASNMGTRRPLSSGGPAPVSTKLPTGPNVGSSRSSRGSGSISSKSSSRSATSSSCSAVHLTSKSSRPSTPTARPTLPVKSAGPRPTTHSRSSTPTPRPLAPPMKQPSRGPTPPRRSSVSTGEGNPGATQLLATKVNNVPLKGLVPPCSSGSAVPAKPSELSCASNGKTAAVPRRMVSVSRGTRSLSAEPVSTNKVRRQSCSPSRGRAPIQSGVSVPAIVRSHANNDDVNPVLIGTKMVERVINARRLAPPKQDGLGSSFANAAGKASQDSTGFGRNLSKKSLDMALRHMDIRQYPK